MFKGIWAPLNGDCYSSRTTQNYYRDVFYCFNTTSAKIAKLQICFLFCFYYLFPFVTIVLSLSMFIFRTSSLIILLPALRQKTEIL